MLNAEVEQQILQLTIALTRAVIGQEIHTHPEHILAAMRQGIDALPIKKQAVSVRVNKHSADLISEMYGDKALAQHQWQIDVDPSLNDGDCIIESERSMVDMLLETRIKAVLATIEQQEQNLQQQIAVQQDTNQSSTPVSASISPIAHKQTASDSDEIKPDASINNEID